MAEELYLQHEGKAHDENPPGRGSGRYAWGEGDHGYQRQRDFYSAYQHLKKKGLSEKEIADGMNLTIKQLRAKVTISKDATTRFNIEEAHRLYEKLGSKTEVAKQMGTSESNVRNYLSRYENYKESALIQTSHVLQKAVDEKDYIDVTAGVELYMNVSKEKLNAAVDILKEQGYVTQVIQVPQVNNKNQKTTVKVLCSPNVPNGYVDVKKAAEANKIRLVEEYSGDGTGEKKTWRNIEPPMSIDSKRIMIRYAEDGGKDKDGVIELRPGVEDLDLGQSKYAQVRIAVDGTHYLKGVALYSNKEMPKGVDIIVNSNKSAGMDKKDYFKEMKEDPNNPFGTTLKLVGGQSHYIGKDGKDHLSAINKVNEEGDWDKWSKTLSSQILSKQDLPLIQKQLTLSLRAKQEEYESIMAIENPVVKARLLTSFADDCDASAVHLKAAALPRQKSHLLLPLTSIKEDQIYAPNYNDGEQIVLFRHPHAGTFEAVKLTVNNKNKDGKEIIGTSSIDAVGINPKVAQILSGADFDGDTVIVAPTRGIGIRIDKQLKDLEGFEPSMYAYPDGVKHTKMKESTKQREMGIVSNLITDMTLKNAPADEMARAVKVSMVVIDAVKHDLNYRQAYKDNNIDELKKRYQNGGGAGTLISRAKGTQRVDERKTQPGTVKIDPKTGEKIYQYTGATYYDKKTGKIKKRQIESTRMAEAKDAYELSSGHPKEDTYASYANELKALGNKARLSYLNAGTYKKNSSAEQTYKKEVDEIDAKLNIALKNAPRERQAQFLANSRISLIREENPDMTKDELKKVSDQCLAQARVATGASKTRVKLTDREWEAIQARAISPTKLATIMNNTDLDNLKKLATPKEYTSTLTSAKIARAEAMLNAGYTQAQVAEEFGVSTSTLMRAIRG